MKNTTAWLSGSCKFASSSPVIGPKINVDETSQKVFDTVLAVARESGLTTTFRVAGGWVRDNLLGVPSDDIDFSMDNLTGSQFAAHMADYAQRHPESGIASAHTIKANPEKSKHLETVSVLIHGLSVDFVNLRVEGYGDSRIPDMSMGTPDTDARRRDLTINALFYNIHARQVEDFMGGEGLQDLGAGTGKMLLKSPRDPGEDQVQASTRSFLNDPLRVLRILRFYSRYPNAVMDPAIEQAMSDPRVQEKFTYVRGKKGDPDKGVPTKSDKGVSPTRSGPELIKLFEGASPEKALRVLFKTGFDKKVFDVPGYHALADLNMDQRNSHHAHTLLEHTLRVVENTNKIANQYGVPSEVRGLMNFSALLHDLGKAAPGVGAPKPNNPNEYSYNGHEEHSAMVADELLRHIGVGEDARDFVGMMVSKHMRPHRHSNQDSDWAPKEIGRFVRETRIHGKDASNDWWKYVMLLSMADSVSTGVGDPLIEVEKRKKHIGAFDEFLKKVPIKPLLGGERLMQMFPELDRQKVVNNLNFIRYVQKRLMDEQASGQVNPENVEQRAREIMSELVDVGGTKVPASEQFKKSMAWVNDNCRFA